MQLILLVSLLFAGWASADSDACSLPKETGPCRAAMPRFYFNGKSGECEQFTYGGCKGNGNNFDDKSECEAACAKQDENVCTLPAQTGYCRGAFPRFFFNSKSGKCENFIYGGCAGNANNFETPQGCENRCGQKTGTDVCKQPKKTGLCRAYIPRLFFNSESGKCEKFVYGGCGANDNNFKTAEACESQCGSKTDKDVCSLPVKAGPCKASFRRFYFNGKSSKCERFIYGGCRGNQNNFESQKECENKCNKKAKRAVDVCEQPNQSGPCYAYFPRYYFNSKSAKCEQFVYGGCQGNDNNFETQQACESRCTKTKRESDVCTLPAETGPCKAAFRRFHFNSKAGKCEVFIYGGCRGNGNNFESQQDCEGKCTPREKRNVQVCRLPKEVGLCKALIPRFFFNHNTGLCETFTYGGCGGNENNFQSLRECENSCLMKKREADVCSLPAETGPCKAAFRRFHFNTKSDKCEMFVYGGCSGNGNNFESQEDCESQCSPRAKRNVQVCRLPKEVGLCEALIPRFFFNHNTGLCEKFSYGGCGGNENNFQSLRECENSCLMKKREADVCSLPAETGPCRAAFPRFAFNGKSGKCERFTYGGCQGNENNFETEEACDSQCSGRSKRNVGVCRLPSETGPCRGAIPRVFFNHKTGQCENFIFGGCGGNENNFGSSKECERSCLMKKREADVCSFPAETGPCRAAFPRFAFDRKSGKCEQFTYGGCGGNDNNFTSEQQCLQACQ